ncbi:unnamed protein product [Rotaria sp. Silwood2]|nr:unnamed protein product [Rotaria sp. Silwood2]CAF4200650.1 unnamed protein product [Rotaria sp. Silwood2]
MAFIILSEQEQIHQAILSTMATQSAAIGAEVDNDNYADDNNSGEIDQDKTNKSITASIKQLLVYTYLACQTLINTNELSSNGFHLSELLDVIDKLFVHDTVVKHFRGPLMMEVEDESEDDDEDSSNENDAESKGSLTHLFCKSLVACRGGYFEGDALEKLTIDKLLNIIWSLTFQDVKILDYKEYTPAEDSWLSEIFASSSVAATIGFSDGTIDDKNISHLKGKIEEIAPSDQVQERQQQPNPSSSICILL